MGWFAALSIGRKLGVILAILGAIAAIIWGVNHWLDGIRESGRNEIRAQWAKEKQARAEAKSEFQTGLTAALAPQFDRLAQAMGRIDTASADINVRMPAAIAAAPRYTDTNCSLTPDVLSQANAARALSETAQ